MDVVRDPAPPRVRVGTPDRLADAVAALGIPSPRPVLVCVGGAQGMTDDDSARVARLVAGQVLPVVERHDAVVLDGGTNSGLMRILGRARRARGSAFPLLGVAAEGTVAHVTAEGTVAGATAEGTVADVTAEGLVAGVAARGTVADATRLEPHHAGVLLVPGDAWGDETPWLARTAGVVAGGLPTVTLVLNGGEVTLADAEQSLAEGRRVLVVAGTGRTADAIAAARVDGPAARTAGLAARTAAVAASRLVTVVPADAPDALVRELDHALSAGD